MRKVTAIRISTYLQKRSSEVGHHFVIKRFSVGRPLAGFHHWADAKKIVSADEIKRDDGAVLFCLLIDWKGSGEWYLVLCDQITRAPIAEVWRESHGDDIVSLEWRYKPSKRDGRNDDRVSYFRNHIGDTTLQISVPSPDEPSLRFINDLFDLADNRLKADSLSAEEPTTREGFPEGEAFERRHLSRERNPALIRLAKARAKKLVCEICGFDFQRRYGIVGHGYIEAHHTIPVKDLQKGSQTRVEDIALVCSNCHRMLHRRRPWLTMSELRAVLATNRTG